MDEVECRSHRYLSLDGGFSGLPALYIIKEVFDRLAYDLKSKDELRPCDFFDVIVGTGKGGLDALLLGRLRLTPSAALLVYHKLLKVIPINPAENEEDLNENHEDFRRAFIEVLHDASLSENTPMSPNQETKCQTLLCTLGARYISRIRFLSDQICRRFGNPHHSILEAAMAVIAAPSFFPPVRIGTEFEKEDLIDATFAYSNPTQQFLTMARHEFGGASKVALILSIGSGRLKSSSLKTDQGVAGDSEQTHNLLHERCLDTGLYFRLNVELGFEYCSLDTAENPEMVKSHMMAYVQEPEVTQRVDTIVEHLLNPESESVVTLDKLNSIAIPDTYFKGPPPLVQNFVGREDILEKMYEAHFYGSLSGLRGPTKTILTGLGGVGKTQLSVRFHKEFKRRFPISQVYFLDASSEARLQDDLRSIIHSLGPQYRSKNHTDAILWLENSGYQWLLIYDNADNVSFRLFNYIPNRDEGHVVITSRNHDLRLIAPKNHHHLEGVSHDEAVHLLLASSAYEDTISNREYASAIATALGNFPLALAHAAGYILVNQCLSTYLDIYRQNCTALLESLPTGLPENYNLSVATTIRTSFQQLNGNSKNILILFSFFNNKGVAHPIIATAAGRNFSRMARPIITASTDPCIQDSSKTLSAILCRAGGWSEHYFNELVTCCRQYSLLQISTLNDVRSYSMHILVQKWLQNTLTDSERDEWLRLVTRLLSSSIRLEEPFAFWSFDRLLLPHINSIPVSATMLPEDHYAFGRILLDGGGWTEALKHFDSALSGLNHRSNLAIAEVQLMHAQCLMNIGRFHQSKKILLEVVKKRTRLAGIEHRDTLRAKGMLASTRYSLGEYDRGRREKGQNVSIQRRTLGRTHPDTLRTEAELARSRGNSAWSENSVETNRKIWKQQEEVLGKDHPDTLYTSGRLAGMLCTMGRYPEAAELSREVLESQRRVLGDDHPYTLQTASYLVTSLNGLQPSETRGPS